MKKNTYICLLFCTMLFCISVQYNRLSANIVPVENSTENSLNDVLSYEKNGISFQYPSDWKITEESINEGAFYLSVENIEYSGIAIFTIINQSLDIEYYLDIYKEGLKKQEVFKDIIFHDPVNKLYNNYQVLSVPYEVEVLGVLIIGELNFFQINNRTVSILTQEGMGDKEYNKQGFELIEKTLTIK